jgi:hypothetical protein
MWLTCHVLTCVLAIPGAPSEDREKNAPPIDAFCGSRCVWFVMGRFGLRTRDLVDLVAEIQGKDARAATLADITGFLENTGIHTRVIRFDGRARIKWGAPVILHLHTSERATQELGHYVVLLPESDLWQAVVWNGLMGVEKGSWESLATRMSGHAILTSDHAVSEAEASAAVIRRWGVLDIAVGGLFVLTVALACARWRELSKRRQTRAARRNALSPEQRARTPLDIRWNAWITVILVGLVSGRAVASPTDSPDAVFCLAAFKAGRERVRSGLVRMDIRATMKRRIPAHAELTSAGDLLCAFDYENNRVRFDFDLQGDQGVAFAAKIIKSEHRQATLTRDGKVLVIEPRGKENQMPCRPMDLRLLGTFGYQETLMAEYEFHALADNFMSIARAGKGVCRRIVEGGVDLYECTLPLIPQAGILHVLVLDPRREYIPVRIEGRSVRPDGTRSPYGESAETDWEMLFGVWVPKQVRFHTTAANGTTDATLILTWNTVNTLLPPSYFDERQIATVGTFVWDHRGGKPILTDVIRENEAPPSDNKNWPTRIAISFVCLALLVGTVLYCWQRAITRRAPRAGSP